MPLNHLAKCNFSYGDNHTINEEDKNTLNSIIIVMCFEDFALKFGKKWMIAKHTHTHNAFSHFVF